MAPGISIFEPRLGRLGVGDCSCEKPGGAGRSGEISGGIGDDDEAEYPKDSRVDDIDKLDTGC